MCVCVFFFFKKTKQSPAWVKKHILMLLVYWLSVSVDTGDEHALFCCCTSRERRCVWF